MIINNSIFVQIHDNSTYKQPNFRNRLNEQNLLKNLSKDTYKAMDVYISNLLNVITNLNTLEIKDVVSAGIQKAKTSDKGTFYSYYSKILKDIIKQRGLTKSNNRENWYAEITKKLLRDNNCVFHSESTYLDVGCGDCNITKSIAQFVNFKPRNTYGIDLLEPKDFGEITRQQFDGGKIPSEIPSPDFVTLFQVLHHTKSQKEAVTLLKSIYDKMNKEGYLLVREHEVRSVQDKKFWKFIHDLQCRIMGTASEDLDNGTNYIPSTKWEKIFSRIGFKQICRYEDISYNDKSSYFMLLKK